VRLRERAAEAEWRLEVGCRSREAADEIRMPVPVAENRDQRLDDLQTTGDLPEVECHCRTDQMRAIG